MNMNSSELAPRALRLELALEAGLALPASGVIAVLHPRAGEILSPLPRERVQIITPHATDHAAFAAQGYTCRQAPEGRFAAALVCLPRSRDEARDLVAQAAALTDGPVIIDGQKTDGAESILRDLRARTNLAEVISKGHGKIAWFAAPVALDDWRAAPGQCRDAQGTEFRTQAGLFSADGIDPASALLASALPSGLKGIAADLGAGWGYLAAHLLATAPGLSALHLIESDARALDCARHNVQDPRAQFHWADATRPIKGLSVDVVVMNPPFHSGRAPRPQLGAAFIRAAAALLKPSGQLLMVANRHLPYETALAATFRKVEELPGAPGFKLLLAQGPLKKAAPVAAPGSAPRAPQKTGRRG